MATLDDQNQPLWFISANTPEELHALMIRTNRKFNKRFHYLNPTFAKGKWYCWFEIPKSDLAKDEMTSGES